MRNGSQTPLIQNGGIVWGLGMCASGSTWLFNVMLKLAESLAPGLPREGRFVADAVDVGDLRPARRLLVVKSHETDAWAEVLLAKAAGFIAISIRDPRDVVASMMQYQKRTFEDALDVTVKSAELCARMATAKRALLLRYEAGFIDDPATLDRLAIRLGGVLPAAERSRIFAATRRRKIEKYIARMACKPGMLIHPENGDLLDPATHWHSHHANRTGEVGRWRRALTREQVREVKTRLGDWMEANFYSVGRVPTGVQSGSFRSKWRPSHSSPKPRNPAIAPSSTHASAGGYAHRQIAPMPVAPPCPRMQGMLGGTAGEE
jgi:hypothetical protein